MRTVEEIEAQLTGPGGPFETTTEEVLGERMSVIKGRARSLRELVEASRAHGDKEYIVHDERRIRFDEHAERYAHPPLTTFTQIFIDPDLRGDQTLVDAERILAEWTRGRPR